MPFLLPFFKANERFAASDMTVAWHSLSYQFDQLQMIIETYPNLEMQQLKNREQQELRTKNSQTFVYVSSDDDNDDYSLALCPLNDQGVVELEDHLEQIFDGLPPGTRSALTTLTKNENETDRAFSERKLMAVLPELISTKEGDPKLKAFLKDLNAWHAELYNSHIDDFEQLLASTAFYYDEFNKRLIIRHYSEDTTPLAKKRKSQISPNTQRKKIKESIIQHLKIDRTDLQIHEIIPMVITGSTTDHVVLKINSEDGHSVVFDSRTGIDTINYKYLGLQGMNTVDCGRFVAAMTIVVFNFLALSPEKTSFESQDFLRYVYNAGQCKNPLELKAFIIEMGEQIRRDILKQASSEGREIPSPKNNGFAAFCAWLPGLWPSSSPSRSHTSSMPDSPIAIPLSPSTPSDPSPDLPPAVASPCRV